MSAARSIAMAAAYCVVLTGRPDFVGSCGDAMFGKSGPRGSAAIDDRL